MCKQECIKYLHNIKLFPKFDMSGISFFNLTFTHEKQRGFFNQGMTLLIYNYINSRILLLKKDEFGVNCFL